MAFRNNDTLIQTANRVDVLATGDSDNVYVATGATTFVIQAGEIGDDALLNFSSNDSIINSVKIFDGNNDGFIQFGPNGVLDIDRSTRTNPGTDSVQVVGENGVDIVELRYLGAKGGQHVYADSATRKNLWADFGSANVIESNVTSETVNMAGGAKVFLVDNALGLNLGGDTITNFGNDDLLVTTSQLFDRNGNEIVTFGKNQVLDISGANGPQPTDPTTGPGGQLDFNTPDLQDVHYLGTNVINGVSYFYYGNAASTFDPTAGA